MDEFLEKILAKDARFDYIRVLNVSVKRPREKLIDGRQSQGSITLTVTVPENKYAEYHASQLDFLNLTKEVFASCGITNYFVVVTELLVSYEAIRITANVLDMVYTCFPVLVGKIIKSSIVPEIKEKVLEITVKLTADIYDWCMANDFKGRLKEELAPYYIYPVKITAVLSEEAVTSDDTSLARQSFTSTFFVSKKTRFVGRLIGSHPKFISSIGNPQDGVVLAGKVCSAVEMKEFKRKPKVTDDNAQTATTENKVQETGSSEESQERIGYIFKFSINDTTGTMEVCYFANSANAGISNLEEGRCIIAQGNITDFNGIFSLNAKSINYCEIDFEKIAEATALLPVPQQYEKIKPRKYQDADKQEMLIDLVEAQEDTKGTYTTIAVSEIAYGSTPRLIYELAMAKVEGGAVTQYLHFYVKLKPDEAKNIEIKKSYIFGGHKLGNVFPDVIKFLSDTTIVGLKNTEGLIDLLNSIGRHWRYGITSPHLNFTSLNKKVATVKDIENAYNIKLPIAFSAHKALHEALILAKGVSKVVFHTK